MAGKTSKSQEGYYAKYKANKTWEKNRIKRLERTLKAQPNNEQVKRALSNMVYRRKTPGPLGWTATQKKIAQLYRQWVGLFDRAIFHPDPKVHQVALSRRPNVPLPKETHPVPESYGKSFFALGARLQGNWTGSR